ncbi:hypothetical protein [Streptomyces collinus]|uniref:hypothetical protein n=1 Tax=Streptomyces collinus TaxID=42684 RepID=UPI0036E85441
MGIAPLADGRAYLYCVADAPEGQRTPGGELTIAQWHSPPATALRDLMLRMTPGSATLNALTPVLDWQPPDSDNCTTY